MPDRVNTVELRIDGKDLETALDSEQPGPEGCVFAYSFPPSDLLEALQAHEDHLEEGGDHLQVDNLRETFARFRRTTGVSCQHLVHSITQA